MINPLLINIESYTPYEAYYKRYLVIQQADGAHYDNMPEPLQNITCVLFRTVLFASQYHQLVKMEELFPVAGRIWYTAWNVSSWTSWRCMTPT